MQRQVSSAHSVDTLVSCRRELKTWQIGAQLILWTGKHEVNLNTTAACRLSIARRMTSFCRL